MLLLEGALPSYGSAVTPVLTQRMSPEVRRKLLAFPFRAVRDIRCQQTPWRKYLEEQLKRKSLDICGLQTNLCVTHTKIPVRWWEARRSHFICWQQQAVIITAASCLVLKYKTFELPFQWLTLWLLHNLPQKSQHKAPSGPWNQEEGLCVWLAIKIKRRMMYYFFPSPTLHFPSLPSPSFPFLAFFILNSINIYPLFTCYA